MKKVCVAVLLGVMMMTIFAGCNSNRTEVQNTEETEEVLDFENESSAEDVKEETQGSKQNETTNQTVNHTMQEIDDLNKEVKDNTKKILDNIDGVFDTLKDGIAQQQVN